MTNKSAFVVDYEKILNAATISSRALSPPQSIPPAPTRVFDSVAEVLAYEQRDESDANQDIYELGLSQIKIGQMYIRKCNEMLDKHKIHWRDAYVVCDDFQPLRKNIRLMTNMMLHFLVAPECQRYLPAYRSFLNATSAPISTIIVTPRQNGKTNMLAQFVAMLNTCSFTHKHLKGMIMAAHMHQSESLLARAKKFISYVTEALHINVTYLTNSHQHVVLSINVVTAAGASVTVTRELVCLAAHLHSVGEESDYVVLDEVLRIPERVYKTVIFPMQTVRDRILIMASSPPHRGSEFMNMIEGKDGAHHVENDSLICRSCRSSPAPWLCRHCIFNMPPWKTVYRLAKMSTDLAHSRGILMSEIFGEPSEDEMAAFTDTTVELLRSQPLKPIPATNILLHDTAFVFMDPGQTVSHHALAVVGIVDGHYTVLAATALDMPSSTFTAVGDEFVRIVAETRRVLGPCKLVLVVEGNSGHNVCLQLLSRFQILNDAAGGQLLVLMTRSSTQQLYGVHTSRNIWVNAVNIMQSSLDTGNMRFADKMVCGGLYGAKTCAAICDQLHALRIVNGKYTGKSSGHTDDLAVAFLMCVYYLSYIFNRWQATSANTAVARFYATAMPKSIQSRLQETKSVDLGTQLCLVAFDEICHLFFG